MFFRPLPSGHWSFFGETCPPSTQGGEKSCSPVGGWVEPSIWQNIFDKAWIMGPQGAWGENHPTKNLETRNHHHLVQDTPHLTSWPHLWKARRSSFWPRGHIHNGHGDVLTKKKRSRAQMWKFGGVNSLKCWGWQRNGHLKSWALPTGILLKSSATKQFSW